MTKRSIDKLPPTPAGIDPRPPAIKTIDGMSMPSLLAVYNGTSARICPSCMSVALAVTESEARCSTCSWWANTAGMRRRIICTPAALARAVQHG